MKSQEPFAKTASAAAPLRTACARIALALVLALSSAAHADGGTDSPELVLVPAPCVQFWTIPGGTTSPAAWDSVLSFAACIQDTTVDRIEHEEDLAGFVEELQADLGPSLELYVEAIDRGPDRIKLRGVYHVALGQVALMTRARSSIASPALRAPLEALLEPHAKLAFLLFAAVDEAARSDPALASDPVSRNMVRSAREHAMSLRTRWPARPRNSDPTLQALTR